jgi:hypothetical protein
MVQVEIAGTTSRNFVFKSEKLLLEFAVDKVALGQAFLEALRFSPVINTPKFHAHLHLNIADPVCTD